MHSITPIQNGGGGRAGGQGVEVVEVVFQPLDVRCPEDVHMYIEYA